MASAFRISTVSKAVSDFHFILLRKRHYPHCLVLAGPRNRFESDSITHEAVIAIEPKFVYTTMYIVDEYLAWDKDSCNSISKIFIPQDDIWKPDVSLRNAFKSFTGLGSSYLNVRVSSSGLVEWNPFQVLASTCAVDNTYFLFDKQKCVLKFTAWSYGKNEVDIYTRGAEANCWKTMLKILLGALLIQPRETPTMTRPQSSSS